MAERRLLAARLREIGERAAQLHAGAEERFMADTVVKYSGLGGLAEQVATELDSVASDYADIARSVRDHTSVWSVITSMRELVTEQTSGGPTHGESIRRIDSKNPPRYPKSGDDA